MKTSLTLLSVCSLAAGVISAPASKCASHAAAAPVAPAPAKMPSYGYKSAAPVAAAPKGYAAAAPVAAAPKGYAAPAAAAPYAGAAAPYGGAAPAAPAASYYGSKGAAAPAAGAYYGKGGATGGTGSGSGSMTSSAAGSTSSAAGSTTSSAAGSTSSAAGTTSTITSTSASTSVVTVTGSDVVGTDVTVIGDASTVTSLFTSTSTTVRAACSATQSFSYAGLPVTIDENGGIPDQVTAQRLTMTVDTCIELIDDIDVLFEISASEALVAASELIFTLIPPDTSSALIILGDTANAATSSGATITTANADTYPPLGNLGTATSLTARNHFTDDPEVLVSLYTQTPPVQVSGADATFDSLRYDTYGAGDVAGIWALQTEFFDTTAATAYELVVSNFVLIITGRG